MTNALPRRGASAPGLGSADGGGCGLGRRHAGAPARPWSEEHTGRLVEEAAEGLPGATGAAATVRAHGGVVRIDLDLVVDHGTHLPTVAEAVRARVAARVETDAGLTVETVTVTVVDLRLPDAAGPEPRADANAPGGDMSAGPTAGG
ncbi:Asp23/Gls24 family envelope stress response protein [Micromonospora sp. NPDC048999]|uniref:Asp23/Gls24 family envelope stress response protein n=1 Tax=Micromonospora sp. NPDC048999 TaxID=3155391 RepID=UPI0033D2D24D